MNDWWNSTVVASILWFLWMARCNRIFKKEFINSYSLTKKILYFSHEQKCLTKWDSALLPQDNELASCYYYICTDGSFEYDDNIAGIGWTLNKNDELLAAGATIVRASSILHTELLAILASLKEAKM